MVFFDAPCSFTEKDRKSVVPDSLSPCALHDFMEFQISGMLEFYSTENTVEQTSGSQKLKEKIVISNNVSPFNRLFSSGFGHSLMGSIYSFLDIKFLASIFVSEL